LLRIHECWLKDFVYSDGLDDGCGTDGLQDGLQDELQEGHGEVSVGLFDGAADGVELAAIEGIDDG
jgi:hypothetical protein